MGINLSTGQIVAYDSIMAWNKSSEPVYVLAGYAGTGKSTMASKIADEISGNVCYAAYTGKAANVLREKGCDNVNTLHGWLYDIRAHNKKVLQGLQFALEEAINAGDSAEQQKIRTEITEKKETFKQPRFTLNKDSMLKEADLVIVDEYSMLDDKLIADLLTVAKKVLFIGDPYQLPPVQGECSLQPEIFLEEIHRQALDSGIIQMSKLVREGGNIELGRYGDFEYLAKRQVSKQEFLAADQLIVGRNNTRHAMNQWYRKHLGYTGLYPNAGEKLICLKNNHIRGLYNGMIGYARTAAKPSGLYYYLNFEDMDSTKVYADDVKGDETTYSYNNKAHQALDRFTFAHAITCHKSQGSEFDNLLVINEPVGGKVKDAKRRWLYTALTRSKKRCTLIQPTM